MDYRFQNQTSIDRATKTADIDTEYDKDAQAVFLLTISSSKSRWNLTKNLDLEKTMVYIKAK